MYQQNSYSIRGINTQASGILGDGKEVAGVEVVVKEILARLYKESKREYTVFKADFKYEAG